MASAAEFNSLWYAQFQFDSSGLETAVNSISGGFVQELCTVWVNVWPVHPTSMEGAH